MEHCDAENSKIPANEIFSRDDRGSLRDLLGLWDFQLTVCS